MSDYNQQNQQKFGITILQFCHLILFHNKISPLHTPNKLPYRLLSVKASINYSSCHSFQYSLDIKKQPLFLFFPPKESSTIPHLRMLRSL